MLLRSLVLAIVVPGAIAGCAVPQYRSRLVPYDGSQPRISAQQVIDICGARAQAAYAQANAAAQGQIDARNNQVTGYNCNTYGQASAYGNYATYSGNTNCSPVTANPYGGKYGGLLALGESLSVQGQSERARDRALTSCAAEHGYRIERQCVANCPGQSVAVSREAVVPAAIRQSSANDAPSAPLTASEKAQITNGELCYRFEFQRNARAKEEARLLLVERGVSCVDGRVVR
jgi:hypothetical protein